MEELNSAFGPLASHSSVLHQALSPQSMGKSAGGETATELAAKLDIGPELVNEGHALFSLPCFYGGVASEGPSSSLASAGDELEAGNALWESLAAEFGLESNSLE